MIQKSLHVLGLALMMLSSACRSNPTDEGSAAKPKAQPAAAIETVRVAIGTQDTTINCATGGPIVRELRLLEKHLPKDGRYKTVKFDIHWENQPTGAQLNSKYLANQLDIVQMADFPSVLGATALKADRRQGAIPVHFDAVGRDQRRGQRDFVPSGSRVQ